MKNNKSKTGKRQDVYKNICMTRIYARINNTIFYSVVMGHGENWRVISDWIVDDEHDTNISNYMKQFRQHLDQARFFDKSPQQSPILIPTRNIKSGLCINVAGDFITLSDTPQKT